MIWRNLVRRKGRTILTILGVSIGIALIIGLGSLASGLEAGYLTTYRLDHARKFMSRNNGIAAHVFAAENMDVGAAYPGRHHPDKYFIFSRFGIWDFTGL